MNDYLIRAERVSRTFGKGAAQVHALVDVDVDVRPGELTVVRGPSGSGKTTLLNILGSLDQISELSVETADLVSGIRKPFVEDIKQLRTFAGNLDRNKGEIDRVMQVLPIKLTKIGRTAIYGSWFNFYLCSFKAHVTLPGNVKTVDVPQYSTGAKRCDLG